MAMIDRTRELGAAARAARRSAGTARALDEMLADSERLFERDRLTTTA